MIRIFFLHDYNVFFIHPCLFAPNDGKSALQAYLHQVCYRQFASHTMTTLPVPSPIFDKLHKWQAEKFVKMVSKTSLTTAALIIMIIMRFTVKCQPGIYDFSRWTDRVRGRWEMKSGRGGTGGGREKKMGKKEGLKKRKILLARSARRS